MIQVTYDGEKGLWRYRLSRFLLENKASHSADHKRALPGGPVRSKKRSWPFPLNIYQTAVGRKWVMALTGIGLIGFVVAHMVGNLHVYERGPARMHEYTESLRTLAGGIVPKGFILWLLRLGLILMFGLHLHSAITLRNFSGQSSNSATLVGGAKMRGRKRPYCR